MPRLDRDAGCAVGCPVTCPAIAAATHRVLRPGGAFLVYQFSPKVRDFLTPHWERIDHDMEWWNVPPAQL